MNESGRLESLSSELYTQDEDFTPSRRRHFEIEYDKKLSHMQTFEVYLDIIILD